MPWHDILKVVILALASQWLYASESQSLESLKQAALSFLHTKTAGKVSGRVQIDVGKLDPRLNLAACSTDLESFLPPGAESFNSNTVGIRCNGNTKWTIFVPVHVAVYNQVLVAAQPISKGTIIDGSLYTLAEKKMNSLTRGYYQDPQEIIGKEAKRLINGGSIISPYDLFEPMLVKKGDIIAIVAKIGNLKVSMPGISLQNGRKGELIQVKNQKSGKTIFGKIENPNEIRVPLNN